jgi:hypothetical protein
MEFYPSRDANLSSQKQKLATDNFLGTLASSSHANPKIHQFPAVQTIKSVPLSVVTKTQPNLVHRQT